MLEELEESRLCLCLCLAVGQKKEAHVHGHVIGLVACCHSASCPCDVWETALAVEVNSSAIVAPWLILSPIVCIRVGLSLTLFGLIDVRSVNYVLPRLIAAIRR